MLYNPSALVSPGNVTLVSTLVASTFTPGITPPLRSVMRPVSVAVGPARRQAANKISKLARTSSINSTSWTAFQSRDPQGAVPATSTTPQYAAQPAILYQLALRMIWVRLEIGVKEFASRRPRTPARTLHRHKHRIDFRQNTWILKLQHPPILFLIVHKKDAQALCLCLRRPARSPHLERRIPPRGAPVSQIKGVKNERFPLRIKNSPKRPPIFTLAVHVEHVDNMQLARAHQVMDIPARRQ